MRTRIEETSRNRIVILTGPHVWHRNTCATLIDAGLDVVGICIADQRTAGLPVRHVWHAIRRRGVRIVAGQILGRLAYLILNRQRDRRNLENVFDVPWIRSVLEQWDGQWHRTGRYSEERTVVWLQSLEPDVLVVHSGYWVARKVRELPKKKIVLGGHPGITPHYRGCHSAFWAIIRGEPEMVGCTVFFLSEGVDTGDVAAQERIRIEPGDTYFSLGWKGMKNIAELQARLLLDFDRGIPIPRKPHKEIPEGSEYQVPTLLDYLKYRRKQRLVG